MSSGYFSASLLCCAVVVLVAGCGGKPDAVAVPAVQAGSATAPASGASAPAVAAGPPVNITTVRAEQRVLPVVIKATGAVTPMSSVDVRSQLTSILSKVHFKEGQFVKAGDLLFTLDSRIDETNMSKARAQLAKDSAALADAKRQLARSKELLAQNFISQGAVDTSQSLFEAQTALISADQAAVDAARVALSYSRITAPQSGRVGAVNVFAGSTVQANVTTLVTITQLDPISVSFSLPQRNLPNALAALKGGSTEVIATLPDSAGAFKGRLQFVDNLVDPSSGTVKVKAMFANPDGKLWPGAFVDIGLTVGVMNEAVVVPQASIIQAARGTVVYVVENGKAALRPVAVLYAQGVDAAVSGVLAGERVVLDGRQNLRPGASVVERPRAPASAADGTGGTGSPGKRERAATPPADAASQARAAP